MLRRGFLIVVAFVLTQTITVAQKDSISTKKLKSYYQIGLGLHLGSGIGVYREVKQLNTGEEYYKYNPLSYGKGVRIFFGLGHKINNNLAIEADLGLNIGLKTTNKNIFYSDEYAVDFGVKQQSSISATTAYLNPKFVFEVPLGKTAALYSKIGVLAGVGSAKNDITEDYYYPGGLVGKGRFAWKYSGGIVFGSTSAIGFKVKTADNIYFFSELVVTAASRVFTQGKMTESVENNTNTLNTRSVSSKEFIYVDEMVRNDDAYVPDPAKPREYPKSKTNYSSIGLNIGFIQYF